MSETDKLKERLRKRVAVKPGLAARALGIGRHLLNKGIQEGSVPVNGIGNIPADWLLAKMEVNNTKGGKVA
jgi:hypothetical protein